MRKSLDAISANTSLFALVAAGAMGLTVIFGQTPASAQPSPSDRAAATQEFKVAQLFQPRGYWRSRYQRPRYQRRSYRRSRSAARPAPASTAWKVDEENKDPVQLIISLPEQKIRVYKGTELVTTNRVSSGKAGHRTPSGVFSILEKQRWHYSNLYGAAPMHHMQRLTWSGVALHASGSVPGYPASHGCVRLRPSFARQLYHFTNKGAHVIIANETVAPEPIEHEKLFQPIPRVPVAAESPAQPQAPGNDEAKAPARSGMDELAALLMPEAANAATVTNVTAVENSPGEQAEEGVADQEAVPSTSPVRILVTRRVGRERVMDIQQTLFELGYQPGDVDGYVGSDTAKAIKTFQSNIGMQANGVISDDLIEKLYRVAGKGKVHQGRIYVRQDFKPVFDAPVTIREPEKLLGTHVLTVMQFEEGATEARWLGLSLKHRTRKARRSRHAKQAAPAPASDATASQALDRVEIPTEIRIRISEMLTPGSSLVISDKGIGPETGKGTDFVALTY